MPEPKVCGPAWFQDAYHSPDGHWLECHDDRPHLAPVIDWIGDYPVSHGERTAEDGPLGGYEYPCLCGHPEYFTCPHGMAGDGSVHSIVLVPTPRGTTDGS